MVVEGEDVVAVGANAIRLGYWAECGDFRGCMGIEGGVWSGRVKGATKWIRHVEVNLESMLQGLLSYIAHWLLRFQPFGVLK